MDRVADVRRGVYQDRYGNCQLPSLFLNLSPIFILKVERDAWSTEQDRYQSQPIGKIGVWSYLNAEFSEIAEASAVDKGEAI